MIYFVEAVGLDRVKIGVSENVAERLKALATGCPCPVRLLRTVKGWHRDERALHTLFAAHRVNGEWFVLSAIASQIERLPEETQPLEYLWRQPNQTPREHENLLREMGLHG